MDVQYEVDRADPRIRPYVRETPVEESVYLSREGACRAFLKLENYQVTGSFKIRGVFNKLLTLSESQRRGVVAASSGNHGAALSYALRVLGSEGTVVVPEGCSPAKLEAIRAYGAEVIEHGNDSVLSEIWARKEAGRRGVAYVSPYNDARIVGGQGTIGAELARQLERVDVVYVAVGGGGLISGIAGYLKTARPDLEIVACSPRNSAVMYESLRAGKVLEMDSLPTISDGTAGGLELDAITFDLCRRYVDRFTLVSEEDIEAAMRLVMGRHHMLVEGAAGVPIAAFLNDGERYAGKNVVLVLCGANVSLDVVRRILDRSSVI